MLNRAIQFPAGAASVAGEATQDGLATFFTWAPAVVLFGPNDAGKTNLLRAVKRVFGGAPTADADLFIQLENLDDDESVDSLWLAELLQFGRPRRPFFAYGSFDLESDDRDDAEARVFVDVDGPNEFSFFVTNPLSVTFPR